MIFTVENLQRLLSIIGAISPFLIAYINLSSPNKSKYEDDQFNKLLVPLQRILISHELSDLDDLTLWSELKDLYISSFQFAPSELNDILYSIISSKGPVPESKVNQLKSESRFLWNNYRKKHIDLNAHSQRSKNIREKTFLFLAYLYIVIFPLVISFSWCGGFDLKFTFYLYLVYGILWILFLLNNRNKDTHH